MKGTLLSCEVETIQTRKDKTLKIVLGTPEMTPAKGAEVLSLMNKIVAVYFSGKETMSQSEMDQVDQIDPEFGGKTQAQRLRNVLYVLYENESEGFKTFDEFYRAKTEAMITHFKSKLPAK